MQFSAKRIRDIPRTDDLAVDVDGLKCMKSEGKGNIYHRGFIAKLRHNSVTVTVLLCYHLVIFHKFSVSVSHEIVFDFWQNDTSQRESQPFALTFDKTFIKNKELPFK